MNVKPLFVRQKLKCVNISAYNDVSAIQ